MQFRKWLPVSSACEIRVELDDDELALAPLRRGRELILTRLEQDSLIQEAKGVQRSDVDSTPTRNYPDTLE